MSFVRHSPPGGGGAAADPGTIPAPNGSALVSTGLTGLDAALGGGIPLGTILLIEEDGSSSHHRTLARYFLGDGAAVGHRVVLASTGEEDLASFLPAEASKEEGLEGEGRGAADDGGDDGLRIAWQYRRYIRKEEARVDEAARARRAAGPRAGTTVAPGASGAAGPGPGAPAGGGIAAGIRRARRPARAFDLTKPAGAGAVERCAGATAGPGTALAAVEDALSRASGAAAGPNPPPQPLGAPPRPKLPPRAPAAVVRIAWVSLGGVGWEPDAFGSAPSPPASRHLLQLTRLRSLVRDSDAAALVTVPAGELGPGELEAARHLAHSVISLHPLVDDDPLLGFLADPHSAVGTARVRKLAPGGSALGSAPSSPPLLLRHRRRRLSVQPLELDEVLGGAGGAAGCEAPRPAAADSCDF